jgi:pimeloyl-ACP methyl ester carboxylesterase
MTLVYLHGFASGPGSTKAQWFRDRLAARGLDLLIPDLAPDFAAMTITSQLAIAEALVADAPAVLMGSSLGGWLATLIAERKPAAVRGLILLAPAFGFVPRWQARLGATAIARWRAAGVLSVPHYGLGRMAELGIGFLDDAARFAPEPDPDVPALVLAGRRDDAVPLASVEAFAHRRPQRRLVVYDTGHELTDVLEPMWDEVQRFLVERGALPAA